MKTRLIAAAATLMLGGIAIASVLPERTAPPSQGIETAAPDAAIAHSAAGPVVAELFTSQGCSSCPPADAVAARLARDPAILVISRPVTYWDRLGWKDSLGRDENTRLQRQYGDRAFAGANIYTPQLVIDGTTQSVGSQEAKARDLIARASAARVQRGISVRVSGAGDGARSVELDGKPGAGAEVMLIALSSRETVKIGRGENGGRQVSYTNVVIGERSLGAWASGTKSFTVPAAQLATPGADRYVVVVRRGAGGAIIGSALI